MRLFIVGMVLGLAATAAYGHGDADWIRQGPYKRTDGISCCGVQDCRKLAPDAAHQDRHGRWIVEGRMMPEGLASYPSEDEGYWICERGGAGGEPLCFFPPVAF